MNKKIDNDFFLQNAIDLAKDLLGKILVRNLNQQIIKARIVETEAYMGAIDQACHSYGYKKTKRTLPMYECGGTIYIYLIYGMYYCFNIVANVKDNPQAVLIRAVEIISKQEVVTNNLSSKDYQKSFAQKTNGPGKLCRALKIDSSLNHLHLLNNQEITLIADNYQVNANDIIATRRINILFADQDKAKLWRFYLKDNKFVSKLKKELDY